MSSKQQCTDEKQNIQKRIEASRCLIKVSTEPPAYLNTLLINESEVLTTIAILTLKDDYREKNEYGDNCLVCLPHDGIPRDTWLLFSKLINTKKYSGTFEINETILDDIFYICFKYGVKFTLMMESESVAEFTDWSNIQRVIYLICTSKCRQIFPRTQNIPEVNEYYKTLSEHYLRRVARRTFYKEKRLEFYELLEIVPPVQNEFARSLLRYMLTD
jgi:hypothetical protein